ncbi:MAG TPA: TIGR04282 family arsenosugar biosynthesis glycosyltransferase, partial [Chloroflexota bacterium]|nr:TIGR04282 family arsenosugar biosynthesis glycosyltransferase [Chloroflexota bacterium]
GGLVPRATPTLPFNVTVLLSRREVVIRMRAAVVYIVAKAPRAGQVKTRLCPPLRPEEAARLAEAFLRDTIALVQEADVTTRLLCRDAAEREALRAYCDDGRSVHVQHGDGLGAAMEGAFVEGLRDGFGAVGVIGTDTPDVPASILREAFGHLALGADVAFGPSTDGGYYFLGAKRVFPTLFREMVWSTSRVGEETLRRCTALALTVHRLPAWSDVDDIATLKALRDWLSREDPGVTSASHTRACMEAMGAFRGDGPLGRGDTECG